jgi:hypothetical protein
MMIFLLDINDICLKNKKIESKNLRIIFFTTKFLLRLYERYIRDQRTLRRLQCRRSHTAHLTESTRNRLLHELERERRFTIRNKICDYRKWRFF